MDQITVETMVRAPIEFVWHSYIHPQDLEQWNRASPDWETIDAKTDFRVGGEFSHRMQAKDGSMGFDFAGVYTEINPHHLIEYRFGDRHAKVEFIDQDHAVTVRVSFEPETVYSEEQQQLGWQAILDNFSRYTEQKYVTDVL
ncbi:uncharacterized protein YndB with AHSA1/START domain [Acinetobacter calcoaceticus]|uniref:Uncharacterized protein YndB with AHSA1/START domain n=1 Tax=Acinetobacter calcoaceticus TaxID=471 RepID=A0A4R1Y1R8_ACICA|nr:uncharacterized protein YndB with AHSA1/START domain [Acinetobacter calcoaceticus]